MNETAKQYTWEWNDSWAATTVNIERSTLELRRMLKRVWKQDGRTGWGCPTLEISTKLDTSQCQGREITLIPRQKCYHVLMHEIVHAMGFDHGRAFRRKFGYLLIKYCRQDELRMVLSAGLYGLTI